MGIGTRVAPRLKPDHAQQAARAIPCLGALHAVADRAKGQGLLNAQARIEGRIGILEDHLRRFAEIPMAQSAKASDSFPVENEFT